MFEVYIQRGVAAWIDDRDEEEFGHHIWRLDAKGRPVRDGKPFVGRKGAVHLDAMLLGTHAGELILHKNNVALDCRRENLEVVNHPRPQRRGADRLNMDAVVLRFLRTFPNQREVPRTLLRRCLETIQQRTGMTANEFLDRIETWGKTNSLVTVWTMEKPAPRLVVPPTITTPDVFPLPKPSARQEAVVKATFGDYISDGTV